MSCLPGTNLIAWVNWKCDSRRSVTEIYGFVFTTTQYILFCKEFPSVLFINFSSIHTFFSFLSKECTSYNKLKFYPGRWFCGYKYLLPKPSFLSSIIGTWNPQWKERIDPWKMSSNFQHIAVASVCPRTWFSLIWSSSFFLLQLLYLF